MGQIFSILSKKWRGNEHTFTSTKESANMLATQVSLPLPALIAINPKLKGEGTSSILNDVTCKTLGDPSAGRLHRHTLLLPCYKIHPGSNSGQPFGIQPLICHKTSNNYSAVV